MRLRLRTDALGVVRSMQGQEARFLGAVAKAMDLQNQLTIGYIQRNKLTAANPPYLNVRTGRLRGSVNASRATVRGSRVEAAVGTNVVYAGVHEFGFVGTVQVKQFQRITPLSKFDPSKSSGVQTVRAHARRVNFKARRMFEHGVEETAQDYADKISDALVAAWQ